MLCPFRTWLCFWCLADTALCFVRPLGEVPLKRADEVVESASILVARLNHRVLLDSAITEPELFAGKKLTEACQHMASSRRCWWEGVGVVYIYPHARHRHHNCGSLWRRWCSLHWESNRSSCPIYGWICSGSDWLSHYQLRRCGHGDLSPNAAAQ